MAESGSRQAGALGVYDADLEPVPATRFNSGQRAVSIRIRAPTLAHYGGTAAERVPDGFLTTSRGVSQQGPLSCLKW